MATPMQNLFQGLPEHRLICRVCEKHYSKYTCPRCNLRYCSLPCYKNHSLRCTELFMRNNVIEEMRGIQTSKESHQKMLEALKRISFDEDGRTVLDNEITGGEGVEDDDGGRPHGTVLSDRTLQLFAEGGDIAFDDLSLEERKDFLRALAAGKVSHLIQPWYPWWLSPRAGTTSITAHGTSLIQFLNPSEEQSKQIKTEVVEAVPGEVPEPPSEALAQVRQLIRGEPSPSIAVQLAEVIYSYCFTLRFCNGDWQSEPLDTASILLNASQVLDQAASPESVTTALADSVEIVCSSTFRHAGGFQFAIALFDDCSAILRLGRACIMCALADSHRLLENAKKQLKAELGVQKQVKLKKDTRIRCGGWEKKVSRSPGKDKASTDLDAVQSSTSIQHKDDATYAELSQSRDIKRGTSGNKKPLRRENETSNTNPTVSQHSSGVGSTGNSRKRRKTSMGLKTITTAIRKMYFIMCWTNEQPNDVFLSVALLIDNEKERLLQFYLGNQTGMGIVQEVKAPVNSSDLIIEEIMK